MSGGGGGSHALAGEAPRQKRGRSPHAGAVAMLAVAVGLVLLWSASVVLPYYVNDLDSVPLADVAGGRHDAKEMWPANAGTLGAWVRAGALLVVLIVPMGLPVLAMYVAFEAVTLWRRWTPAAKKVNLATLALLLGAIVVMWSAWGQALTSWLLD